MKVAPVSADLLIKLAIGVAVIGAAVWAVRRTSQAIGDAIPDVGGWIEDASSRLGVVADSLGTSVVNLANTVGRPGYAPADQLPTIDNQWGIILTPEQQARYDDTVSRPLDPASRIGQAVTGDKYWSLGSWLYDVFNPEPPPPDVGIGYGAIDARRIDRSLGY